MSIETIEKLKYYQAKGMAIETIQIKDHDVFFVDFDDAFGYSALVFKNQRQIHYANEYELHYGWMREEGRDVLREYYINKMNKKLFTDDELMEEVKTYDDYNRKSYFLRNYWIMRYEHVSAFYISEEDGKAIKKAARKLPYYNNISFCYVESQEIVDEQRKILDHLESEFEKIQGNEDIFREMIRYQLANHEYCVTCDWTEALRSLGFTYNILTEIQKRILKEEANRQIRNYC